MTIPAAEWTAERVHGLRERAAVAELEYFFSLRAIFLFILPKPPINAGAVYRKVHAGCVI